ncbi:hypothetical protein M0802_008779 [Mischocyttarus mexicanus]|nr:hypothetical protein M0802_008779 [Mischocyttarus mexicanus]
MFTGNRRSTVTVGERPHKIPSLWSGKRVVGGSEFKLAGEIPNELDDDPEVGPRRANNCEQLPFISSWLRTTSVASLSTPFYYCYTGKTIVLVILRVGLYLRFAIALVLQSLETLSAALNPTGIPPSILQPEAFLPYISISALDRPPPQLDARTTFPPGKLIGKLTMKN